jgi:hypothetical protein
LSISPAINDVEVGDTVKLTIFNNSDEDYEVDLSPVVISFPEDEDRASFRYVDNETIRPGDYITLSNETMLIGAGSNQSVEVAYLEALPGFVLGVQVGRVQGEDNEIIGTNAEIVSLLIDYSLDETDILGISTSLSSKLNVEILNLELNNKFLLETEIFNDSRKVLKPTGEIEVYEGDIKIGNISLTQKFKESLLPGESVVVESHFVDDRNAWDRLGKLSFKQNISFEDQISSDEIEIFVFPYQVLIYLVVLLIIVLVGVRIFYTRKELVTQATKAQDTIRF